LYREAVAATIDDYHASRPTDFSELVEWTIQPDSDEPRGIDMRLRLRPRIESDDRVLELAFRGVESLKVDELSAGSFPILLITSTRDRGWESPRFLVDGDQGRVSFGCREFTVAVHRSGDIPGR
jgi:hypothetical protein